jgi:hypothetical protein
MLIGFRLYGVQHDRARLRETARFEEVSQIWRGATLLREDIRTLQPSQRAFTFSIDRLDVFREPVEVRSHCCSRIKYAPNPSDIRVR